MAIPVAVGMLAMLATDRLRADDTEEWNQWKSKYESKILPIIKAKCLKCHEGESPDGEFDLSKFPDGNSAVEADDVWERVAKRVRTNEMPPPKSPGLKDREKSEFHHWVDSRPGQDLCTKLASDETQSWYRGHVMSRRLSQLEYRNAVRDLLGYYVPVELLPPADGAGGEGFDTVGDSLFTSPIHLEAYLRVTDSAVDRLLVESIEKSRDAIASNRALLVLVEPTSNSEVAIRDAARKTLRPFLATVWRRPATDQEVDRLMQLFDRSISKDRAEVDAGYIFAIKQPIKAALLSPNFLFLVEPEPESSGIQRLPPYQFAARMSMLLWSSVPDEILLGLAADGSLMEPDVIRQQLRRMLADDRSRALGENFGLQWLGLRDFLETRPDNELFPQYDSAFARDAIEETIRFVSNVFREDRPLTELMESDYVIVNSRLASHYGLHAASASDSSNASPFVGTDDWRRISLPPDRIMERGGVTTMASVLTKTSYPRRTSPVLRGRWVLEEILGSKVPPPPPNVPALEENSHAEKGMTLRQRLEEHRKNTECASCHDRMDPIGFGLENYDAIGRWRNDDNGEAIDTTGTLPSGDKFTGASELKKILIGRRDEFYQHMTKKMAGFALGRELNKFDQCIIDKSVKRLAEENRSSVILEEILLSYPFQHRYYNSAKSKNHEK